MRIAARVALVAFLSLVVATTTGLLASNSLPATKLGQNATAVTANGLKPADCASISLTNTVIGSGTVAGSSGNDLVLGSSGSDIIDGGAGDDCIVGGAGSDTITGGLGTDVCIGSATTTFVTCETTVIR
jgi:Ca2+-binding RTX toxin-like protein